MPDGCFCMKLRVAWIFEFYVTVFEYIYIYIYAFDVGCLDACTMRAEYSEDVYIRPWHAKG